jgi:hypothetical protein
MVSNEIVVYEGALCCPTGVCGPEPDKALIDFNEAIKKIQSEGNVSIIRASISFDINRFLQNPEIFQKVKEHGPGILPITTVNGKVVLERRYPTLQEFEDAIKESV